MTPNHCFVHNIESPSPTNILCILSHCTIATHVHHPRFLEWVVAPESARLLSHPPAEWLQVMNRQDTLLVALQLQMDASLMSSNLTVLHQYAVTLHWISTEVLHSVFGREFFPSRAVNDAAPVPACFGATHMAAIGLW